MSDRHVRILRVMARHRQRRLDDHDAAALPQDAASAGRRHDLQRTAALSRARLVAAELRRHWRPGA